MYLRKWRPKASVKNLSLLQEGGVTMAGEPQGTVTHLLAGVRAGKPLAKDQLVELVYDELRRLARSAMRRERPDHTLQPTALVNEAFVRLLSGDQLQYIHDRAYFYAAAAQAMRQVLVDHARQRKARKRGGSLERVPLDGLLDWYEQQQIDVLVVDEAVEELGRRSERQRDVVMLRVFGGLSMQEIADGLGVSVTTARADWRVARAWLRGAAA
jgi:RNA polymerase sigma factor (TIGR02999 family)